MTDAPEENLDEVVQHNSPIDEAARRERLAEKGYDEDEIIRDANFSHGFDPSENPVPQRDISETPAPQRTTDTY